jgi:hypothetical protein
MADYMIVAGFASEDDAKQSGQMLVNHGHASRVRLLGPCWTFERSFRSTLVHDEWLVLIDATDTQLREVETALRDKANGFSSMARVGLHLTTPAFQSLDGS